ncbi:MAG: hypothetical protein RI575_07000 [Balneolaceae bacterium]|nr:hypothetical protein [Balneolaceae bacterium]MDR9407338.1 hypothetical protein [Balneolaceae bacterium]
MKTIKQTHNIFNIKSLQKLLMLTLLSSLLISFAGCGSDSSTSVDNNPNQNNEGNEEPVENQEANEVWMDGNAFNVSNLEVEAGTTVTWTNKSNANHTVTSGERGADDAGELFDSGSISPGGVFSFTFD